MAPRITHQKVSSGTVNPKVEVDLNDWNDDHTITGLDAADSTFTQAGTGAVTRTVDAKLKDYSVHVREFTPSASLASAQAASTDAVSWIQAAIDAVSANGGGTVDITGGRWLIDSADLVIREGVKLVGPWDAMGQGSTIDYGTATGSLVINSAHTVTVMDRATLNGCGVFRKGLRMATSQSDAEDQLALFAGTAITIEDGTADASIRHNLIVGFDQAIYSSGAWRQNIEWNQIDCNNGIEITACADVARVRDNHAWPFYIAHQTAVGTDASLTQRPGTAFYFHDQVDTGFASGNFSIGYNIGFHLKDLYAFRLIGNGADNFTSELNGNIGFLTEGTMNGVEISDNHADSNNVNYKFAHTAGALFGGANSSGQAQERQVRFDGGTSVFSEFVIGGSSVSPPIRVDDAVTFVSIGTVVFHTGTASGSGYEITTTSRAKMRVRQTILAGVSTTDGYSGGTVASPAVQVGSGNNGFFQGGGVSVTVNGVLQAAFLPQASAVNYQQFRGGVAGNPVDIFAEGSDANIYTRIAGKGNRGVILGLGTQAVGFYGSGGSTKQTITGSRGSNAALASLLTALAALGVITDSSTT